MFAEFDKSNFPQVYVRLKGTIKSDEDFYNFSRSWLQLYRDQKNFSFIFETKECDMISIKYCIFMALFIKKLKKEKIQYLSQSSINVHNSFIYNLLKLIFYIQKPVAPVKIYLKYLNPEKVETINP